MATRKMIFNIDEELLGKVDAYAAKLHINRTACISVILSQYIDQQNTMAMMPQLLEVYNKQQERSS